MGTPPKGCDTSAASAVSRACSSSTKHTALSDESATAASDASRASVGEMVPARNASTSEQASSIHGCPVMGQDATGSIRHPAPPRGRDARLAARRAARLAARCPTSWSEVGRWRDLSPSGQAQVQCGRVLLPVRRPARRPARDYSRAPLHAGHRRRGDRAEGVGAQPGRDHGGRPGQDRHHLPAATRRRGWPRGCADHAGPAAPAGRPGLMWLPRHGAPRSRVECPALRPEEGTGLVARQRPVRRLVGFRSGLRRWPGR